MKKLSPLLIVPFILLMGCRQELIIDGKSGYQIVIPVKADSVEKYAAEQLRDYLYSMSGTTLPLTDEYSYNGNNAIYIGRTSYAESHAIDFSQLEEDGYAYKSTGSDFIIAGGTRKGVLYGVYDLLESFGFRKYTSDCTIIPRKTSVSLPENDTVVIPEIKYRTTS